MSVNLNVSAMKYKDPSTGQYKDVAGVLSGGTVESPVQDVQVNGTSILDAQGVANVPKVYRTGDVGVVKLNTTYGIQTYGSGDNASIGITYAELNMIKNGTEAYRANSPIYQHAAAFYGLAKAAGSDEKNSTLQVGKYTESAKSAIHEMLNGSVAVTGTTPSITALPGIRYVCGEVTTIDITTPEIGIIDVVFTSGSTPAVLTVTPPTGQTMKWANGFYPTALEANTTYEINIMDGVYGVVGQWT